MMREMKESGIEWIGRIPEEWEVSLIGNLYDERKEKVSDKDYAPLSVTKNGIVPQLETAAKTNDGDNRKLVKRGDFCINSRSDRKGSCGVSNYDGSVSLINTILEPKTQNNIQYYNWLFRTSMFADEFYKWGHGIVDDLWTTRWQEMKNISIVVPCIDEQCRIATFLDNKCSEIDQLISLQEQFIEELKAYKQSVITEAVTKGLNPEVEMKESGVEWIGRIPKEWKVSRVGLHYNIILGRMLCPKPLDETYTLEKYYCAANVHFEGITGELKQMWFSSQDKSIYKTKKDDLLIVEGGAGAGGCAILEESNEDIYIQNSIMIARPKRDNNCRYLKYLIEQLVKKGYIDIVCNKATIPHFTKEKVSNVPFLVMPPNEQRAIATYLDTKCAEIDSLIALKQQKIDALKDYKKSMIYEYVTGKKQLD